MSQTMPPPVFDPFAPGFTDDPYPQYAALRSGAPAGRHPLGFFLLTRYDDVSGLLRAGMSVEDGLEQGLLTVEVVVHRAPGHLAGGRHVLQGCPGVPARGEQAGGLVEQRRPGGLRVQFPPAPDLLHA